jgi:hypothetical protein
VSFTDKFKYLGSIIADKLTDEAECDAVHLRLLVL